MFAAIKNFFKYGENTTPNKDHAYEQWLKAFCLGKCYIPLKITIETDTDHWMYAGRAQLRLLRGTMKLADNSHEHILVLPGARPDIGINFGGCLYFVDSGEVVGTPIIHIPSLTSRLHEMQPERIKTLAAKILPDMKLNLFRQLSRGTPQSNHAKEILRDMEYIMACSGTPLNAHMLFIEYHAHREEKETKRIESPVETFLDLVKGIDTEKSEA